MFLRHWDSIPVSSRPLRVGSNTKLLDNWLIVRMFGPKMQDVKGGWRKFHGMIKSRRIK
jgi:hypothetical protein